MNSEFQFEDRASSSRSKHEGESSSSLCDRLSRTRDFSQRQLPTDHDYAVPTREYQTDQSSLKPAQTAARPVLERRNEQRQNNPTNVQRLTGPLHIRDWRLRVGLRQERVEIDTTLVKPCSSGHKSLARSDTLGAPVGEQQEDTARAKQIGRAHV